MSSDSQLEQIGEKVLSNHLNGLNNEPDQDIIHTKSIELSRLLNSVGNSPKSLTKANATEINTRVQELVSLLTSEGKGPSMNLGDGQSDFEAYNLITYSLLLLQKTEPTEDTKSADVNNQELDNYAQLICENEQLKSENQKLIEENRLISAESKNHHKIVNQLCKKFNLSKEANFEEISSHLSSYELNDQEKHLSTKDQEIAELLATRESQSKQIQDLKNEINSLKLINHEENVNSKIYVLEADISSLTLQNQNLVSELSKQKDRYRTVNQNYQSVSSELTSKSLEIEDLQMKLNKLSIERDELQNLINIQKTLISDSNENKKDDEQTSTNAIMDVFSKQIEELTKELTDISEERNRLFTLLHKQKLAIDMLEKANLPEKEENEDDKYNSSDYVIHSIMEKINKPASSNENNQDSDLIQILSNDSQKSEDRIISAFSYLQKQNQDLKMASPKNKSPTKSISKEDGDNESSKSLHLLSLISETETDNEIENEMYSNNEEIENLNPEEKIELLKQENQRMCIYMMSILRFLDKVANSSETQDWMLDSLTSSEIRDSLVSQCKRIESFIKQRHIECEGFSFPELPRYVSSNIDEIADKKELVTTVMICAMANDVMRKYIIKVEEQMEILTEELKAMKSEISHSEPLNNNELEQMKLDNIQMAQELKKIKLRLQEELEESNPIPDIEKAKLIHQATLAIRKEVGRKKKHSNKNKKDKNYDDEDDDDIESCKYYKIIEAKLFDEIQKNEGLEREITKISEEAKNAVHLLKKKVQAFQSKINESEQQIDSLTLSLDNIQKELEETNERIKQKDEDNKKLNETISELTSTISQTNEKKQEEFNRMTKEMRSAHEDKIKKFEEEVQKLNNELHEKDEEMVAKLKEVKKTYKAQLKESKAALEKQNQRASDIREYYEPLLNEMRQKLAESREKNATNLKNLQSQESEVKELKSELSALKVESKMNQMKLMANEEKMKRDKNLFETQLKMKILSMETSHSTEVEQLKSNYERQFHDFLISISSNFKEFIDFNSPITGESTVKLFLNVRQKIDSLKLNIANLENHLDEIGDIKEILNLSKDCDIIPRLTELSNKEKELERHSNEIDDINRIKESSKDLVKKEDEVRKWEKWAKRLHATITDEFSSQKSPLELQFVIEEALMSSIGQRQIWRHVEILRSEKLVLLRLAKDNPCLKIGGINDQNTSEKVRKGKKNSLLTIPLPDMLILTLCFTAIYRLQKLSGHLHGAITFYDDNSESGSFSASTDIDSKSIMKKSKKKSDANNKKYPILSFK